MATGLTDEQVTFRIFKSQKIHKDRAIAAGGALDADGGVLGVNALTGLVDSNSQPTTSYGTATDEGGGLYGIKDLDNLTAGETTELAEAAVSGVLVSGVSIAGAEFTPTTVPATYGTHYIYPSTTMADYYIDSGSGIIRIPFLWERIQPTLGGELDTAELARLHTLIDHITGRSKIALLDLHNYARYRSPAGRYVLGTDDLPTSSFADLWSKLATEFTSSYAHFSVMNEPYTIDNTVLATAIQEAITAIRATGNTNKIYVSGKNYAGADSLFSSGWANRIPTLVDSANNLVLEVHQYADSDGSGTSATAVNATIFTTRIMDATLWARAYGYKLHLGEFNTGDRATITDTADTEYDALIDLYAYLKANADVWDSATIWAAGPWWGTNIFSVEPISDVVDIRYSALIANTTV